MNAETIRHKKQPSASHPVTVSLHQLDSHGVAHLALPEAVLSKHNVGLPTQGRIARTFPDKDAPVMYLLAASGPRKATGS